ncbi:MAG: TatD family hydrolase [Patescibacteria group bacterium]
MRLFDSHTHIHFPAFTEDVPRIMAHAKETGLGMLTVGTLAPTNAAAVAFAEKYDNVWAAVGIHPSHVHPLAFHDEHELAVGETHRGIVQADGTIDLSDLDQYLTHPKVVAIGEFGLDFYRLPEDGAVAEKIKEEQRRAAWAHLALCSSSVKPAVIHCRDAHADMQRLIAEEIAHGGLARRGVIHCFTGTLADAEAYIELGFMISFSGIVTFAKSLQETAKHIPLTSMLVETDAPYLAPVPYRGKRNEPAYVEETAKCIANLRGVSFEEVATQTVENAKKMFGIG